MNAAKALCGVGVGRVGLKYESLPIIATTFDVELTGEVFDGIQLMELTTLRECRKE